MIKFLILDVDGTLTDGKIYIGNLGEIFKAFDIKDGYGIHNILPELGITPIVITGRESEIVLKRCEELSINYVYQGVTDKLRKLDELLVEFSEQDEDKYSYRDCAYIGDDILDLYCMKIIKEAGGWTASPADAVEEVKEYVNYVAEANAGNGAVRECILELRKILLRYKLEERIEKAILYISKLDKEKIEFGKHVVDEDFYFDVTEYISKPVEQCRFESHRKYVDIQWIIAGNERIDTAYISELDLDNFYDLDKDVVFWKERTNSTVLHTVLSPGSYTVFYPNNAHKPGITPYQGKEGKVKKIVGKVRI